jgi:hypothetical protein
MGPAEVSSENRRSSGLLKSLLQAAQKDPEARRAKNRSFGGLRTGSAKAYLPVRCSEAVERNKTYGSFSAACFD